MNVSTTVAKLEEVGIRIHGLARAKASEKLLGRSSVFSKDQQVEVKEKLQNGEIISTIVRKFETSRQIIMCACQSVSVILWDFTYFCQDRPDFAGLSIEPLIKVDGNFGCDGERKGLVRFQQSLNGCKPVEADLFDKIRSHHHHSGHHANKRANRNCGLAYPR
ncbi:MAG: hypothetical protein OXC62_03735 [Aestuariivita sp.]|nr:hypothetical protein [Aestuariivita sp.]